LPDSDETALDPPIHIEETIKAIARLHAEHRASATRHHRVVEAVANLLGRPGFLIALTVLVASWIGANGGAAALGYRAPDPPPFAGLAGFSSLASLYLVVVIVTTQRRDDRLARHRELLTLELAVLTEQKAAAGGTAKRQSACPRSGGQAGRRDGPTRRSTNGDRRDKGKANGSRETLAWSRRRLAARDSADLASRSDGPAGVTGIREVRRRRFRR